MYLGRTVVMAVAALGLMAWQGEKAPAQEGQGSSEPAMQTQVPGQAPAAVQMRKGYPGIQLRKMDGNQTVPKDQKNRISRLAEEERQQLRSISADRTLTREQKLEKVRQIRAATHDKINALLSPEERKRYEKSQENERKFQEAMSKKLHREVQRQ